MSNSSLAWKRKKAGVFKINGYDDDDKYHIANKNNLCQFNFDTRKN